MNSEEQYKFIEQKIVEASQNVDYDFDEASWQKMEKLLDDKKSKRRGFFWLFAMAAFLFIGGLIFKFFYKDDNKQALVTNAASNANVNSNQKTQNISPVNKAESVIDKNAEMINNDLKITSIDETKTTLVETSKAKKTEIDKSIPQKSTSTKIFSSNELKEESDVVNKTKFYSASKKYLRVNSYVINSKSSKQKKKKTKTKIEDDEILYDDANATITNNQKSNIKITTPELANEEENTRENPMQQNITQKDSTTINTKKKKEEVFSAKPNSNNSNKKEKKKKQNNFYILASIGTDVASTKFLSFKNSPITPHYGFQIGYQFNNKLSMQAGIYASAKKYVAQKNEYKTLGSYWNYVDLIQVDANCYVYEIPLTVQYNFLAKKRSSLFGSAGLSSFIMKKEDYVYHYYYNNVYYQTPKSYEKNTHLLATANFSFGYEYKLNNKFNVQASPRFSIPLGGVGEGRVNLFSSGIDFGVKYFPFNK